MEEEWNNLRVHETDEFVLKYKIRLLKEKIIKWDKECLGSLIWR